jgi:hypothetical protein
LADGRTSPVRHRRQVPEGREPAPADYHGAKGKISKMLEIGIVASKPCRCWCFRDSGVGPNVSNFPPDDKATVVRVVGEQSASETFTTTLPRRESLAAPMSA